MRERRRQLATMLALSTAALFVGCAEQVGLPDDADAELRAGAEVFRARCASCHGVDGGGAIGPSLRQVEDRLDDDAQRSVVVDGRGSMPAFGATLNDADIDAVVRYTREVL